MGRTLSIALSRLRSESGVTLAEMLVGMLATTFVLAALFGLLDAAGQAAPRDQERAVAIREGQSGLHRMTRELRQANKVWIAGNTQIHVNIGDDKHVFYNCDAVHPDNPGQRRCLRWEAAIGSDLVLTGPGDVVVDRRTPGDVFTYAPNLVNPTFVRVHVEVPQSGERAGGYGANLVLDDGFYLRNTDVG